jgi:tetratricopeptide (TPR) repeat protein
VGASHPFYFVNLINMSNAWLALGDLPGAWEGALRALGGELMTEGVDGDNTLVTLNLMANEGVNLERADVAQTLGRAAVALASRRSPVTPEGLPDALETLGDAELQSGQPAAAAGHYARAFELRKASIGPDNPLLAGSLRGQALAALASGQTARAAELLERVLGMKGIEWTLEPEDRGELRFALARILAGSPQGRARALSLAAQAWLDFGQSALRTSRAAEVRAWLRQALASIKEDRASPTRRGSRPRG